VSKLHRAIERRAWSIGIPCRSRLLRGSGGALLGPCSPSWLAPVRCGFLLDNVFYPPETTRPGQDVGGSVQVTLSSAPVGPSRAGRPFYRRIGSLSGRSSAILDYANAVGAVRVLDPSR
jgi:hypothetical protein